MDLARVSRGATLSERAAGTIRDLIESGEWAVGTRIPAENDLVDRLGVSRNTVREALRALVHVGLLEARVGDGTYVRAVSELRSALVRRSSRSGPREVLELRAVLEEYAAERAAEHATRSQVRHLRKLLDAIPAAVQSSMGEVAALDVRFHREIVAMSDNALLIDVYDHLGAALDDLITNLAPDPAIAHDHDRWHHALVDAIEAHDSVGARHASAMLIDITRRSSRQARRARTDP